MSGRAGEVIDTLHLFGELDALLLHLLRDLSDDDWRRPTIAGTWTVRDVAAHLLDTALRRLTLVRDGWARADVRIAGDADLRAFVHRANAEGVAVYGRLSRRLLIDLTAMATSQLHAHLGERSLTAAAAFPVSWAGESVSAHWFDVAREYTERWHHQAQMRLAVTALPPLMREHLYAPVLATFVRALPHALRDVDAPDGATVRYDIEGAGGGAWLLSREAATWRLASCGPDGLAAAAPRHLAAVRVPADLAWRLFTAGVNGAALAAACTWDGRDDIARTLLGARAIVA